MTGEPEVDLLDAYSATVVAVAERVTPSVASLLVVGRPVVLEVGRAGEVHRVELVPAELRSG